MSSSRAEAEPPSSLDAEAAELGRAHVARWLDELLPPGPCLVWAGGVMLAAVLAADRRRPVLLVEPRPSDLEEATRRARPGVMLGGADAIADGQRFDSGVIAAGPDQPAEVLEGLLGGALRDAVVAVLADPGQVDPVVAALEAGGRHPTTVRQHVRLSSTLGAADGPVLADCVGPPESEPTTVIVLDGAAARASVLVGQDAGALHAWADIEWVRRSIREVDAELRAVDAVRLSDLEAQLAGAVQRKAELAADADELQQRIDDLEGSTSWRMTAPLRRLADRVRRL